MSVTIYHNPDCGTSRNTLAMIRQSGAEPAVIEYLKTPPSRETLKQLIATMGISARALLRENGTPYKPVSPQTQDRSPAAQYRLGPAHPFRFSEALQLPTSACLRYVWAH
jgi:arsenate reductase (glutaredoxin)